MTELQELYNIIEPQIIDKRIAVNINQHFNAKTNEVTYSYSISFIGNDNDYYAFASASFIKSIDDLREKIIKEANKYQ